MYAGNMNEMFYFGKKQFPAFIKNKIFWLCQKYF